MIRIIVSIIGLVLAGGVFFSYTKPQYDEIRVTQAQIAEYEAALQKDNELQSRKQTLLKRYNAFNQVDLERLQKLLPDHVDNVRLILDLDNLAGRHNLALENVDVSSSKSAGSKNQTAPNIIGTSNQKYDSITLTFGMSATYPEFVRFLNDMESSLRIVDLLSLTIDQDGSGVVNVSSGGRIQNIVEPRYRYNITFRTYWLR